ncbi:hypothetical protein MNB_SM-4-1363 [hydrothermal vent metagenome]|uniref:Uncharacterized protein n=1 Tax=hydrothermal vent metagenome TaxID=652676 RepID=A0A1W1CRB8_9ZZZZ
MACKIYFILFDSSFYILKKVLFFSRFLASLMANSAFCILII